MTRPSRVEHALLATPRRDMATVAALAVVTASLFVAMAMAGSRARIGRLDAHFLHLMVSIRTPWLTTIARVFNFIGLTVVTVPIRLLIAGFLAIRRRSWHLAAFASAVVVSEVFIGTLKGLYARGRPPGSLVATSGYSFPSGHAINAWALASVVAGGLCGQPVLAARQRPVACPD